MKISFNWLKSYIKSETDLNELVEIITNTGLEVSSIEKYESVKGGLKDLIIGEVKSVGKHPNADRLSLTKVDVGNGNEMSIVCGAPNVATGQKVVVALPNTTLYPFEAEPFTIKTGKIRGEISEGMICAEDEIGLSNFHDGIMVLKKSAKVGMALNEYFNVEEDYTIEVDLTPNRTDAISHFGVARDYLAVKNLQTGFKKEKINIPDVGSFAVDNTNLNIKVEVLDKAACPRYSALTMTDVKVEESPEWLKNRLRAIGLKPINNIVDAANFVMYETGQPMHVFDAEAIEGDKVIVKKVEKGRKFFTLDKIERTLSEDDLMICNASDPMCMAGVFGGLTSGVKESTTKIFIESAYFSPSGIRKTAKRHGLSTDASYRYERGGNPDATIYALKRLSLIIKDLTGALVSSEIVDEYPFPIDQKEISLRWSYLNKVAGKEMLKEDVRTIFSSLDIDIMMEEKESIKLRIPGYRTEVSREIDIVEEILRIYGYNNIDLPVQMHTSLSNRPEIDKDRIYNLTADYLSANGFREILNNSLTSADNFDNTENLVKLMNPLSSELSVLRKSMLEGGLETISYNANHKSENLSIYELGKVYSKYGEKYVEEVRLNLWITGQKWEESWRTESRDVNFYDAKEVTLSLLNRIGFKETELSLKESESNDFDYGLSIHFDGKSLGRIGKISSMKLKKFDIENDVFAVEFNWENILKATLSNSTKYSAIPKFPSVRRDLALLIDVDVKYADIEQIAHQTEKSILREVNLFDVYRGKGIDPGKKSYAVSFVFRDDEKTLTDKQVDKVMEKMIERLKNDLKAELR